VLLLKAAVDRLIRCTGLEERAASWRRLGPTLGQHGLINKASYGRRGAAFSGRTHRQGSAAKPTHWTWHPFSLVDVGRYTCCFPEPGVFAARYERSLGGCREGRQHKLGVELFRRVIDLRWAGVGPSQQHMRCCNAALYPWALEPREVVQLQRPGQASGGCGACLARVAGFKRRLRLGPAYRPPSLDAVRSAQITLNGG
jgi:hypothetical protein